MRPELEDPALTPWRTDQDNDIGGGHAGMPDQKPSKLAKWVAIVVSVVAVLAVIAAVVREFAL